LYLAAEQQVEKLIRASDLDVGVDGDRVECLVERIQDLVRADGRASLEAVGEVLALEHLLESRLAKQSQHVGALHLAEPFGVASNLELVAIEDEMDLDVPLAKALEQRSAQGLTGRLLKKLRGSGGRTRSKTATIGLPIAFVSGTAMCEPLTPSLTFCCRPSSCPPPLGLPAAISSKVSRTERTSPVTTPMTRPDTRLNTIASIWIWV